MCGRQNGGDVEELADDVEVDVKKDIREEEIGAWNGRDSYLLSVLSHSHISVFRDDFFFMFFILLEYTSESTKVLFFASKRENDHWHG